MRFALTPIRFNRSPFHAEGYMSEATILIADSNAFSSYALARFLSGNGLKPVVCTDLQRAFSKFSNGSFDIAIFDCCNRHYREKMMSALVNRTVDTAVILICGRHSAETERAARVLSPAFFFVKPIDTNDLLAVVLRVIEMKNRRKMLALRRKEQREGVFHG
jgi:DNA-binding NtrC family response regulator